MPDDPRPDALTEEQQMREHEREARERDSDERGPDAGADEADRPAPPGNIQDGTISGGG
jgi:hypothetical protein